MTDTGDDLPALLVAAGESQIDALEALLRESPGLAGAVGDNPYWGGRVTPLHVAASWGRDEAVSALLAAGADPSGDNEGYGGWSPLLVALGKGHHDIARRLVAAGAHLGPFEVAALGRSARMAELLHADPELAVRPLPDGTTLLHVAADGAVAGALLAAGADPDAVDSYGGRPLERAISKRARGDPGGDEVVRALLSAGVRADAATLAALGDLAGLARDLTTHPAALDLPGSSGATPLHAAIGGGRPEVVDWLLDRGADANAPDAGGISPLHATSGAPRHAIGIAARLLDAGADPTARDPEHDATPASWAAFQRRPDLAELLRAAEENRRA